MNANQIWEVLTRALGQSDVVQKLGWMLLHSIWQGAAGACVLWIFLLATRGLRDCKWSNIRYIAACMAMLAVLFASAITFARSMRVAPAPARISTVFPANSPPDEVLFFQLSDHPVRPPPAKFDPHSLIPITVYLWFIGVAIQSLWQFAGWIRLRRLRQGVPITDPIWIETLQNTSGRLGIRKVVRLVVGAIDVPAVIGAFRPVIIIPLALVNELSPQQVQAILAHELAHIRRWDYAVNLIQTAVETLFFYHPAVWWISAQIRRERENCCDDIAANLCGDPKKYAGTLIKLEERRADSPRLSLAATDGSLIERIRRLLAVPTPRTGRARSILVASIGLICVLVPISCQGTSHAQATQPSAQLPGTQPDAARRQRPPHIVAVDDVILVSIMDLRGEGSGEDLEIAHVSDSGNINLPSIPPLHVEGLTEEQLHDAIAKAYVDANMIRNPQVTVTLDTRTEDGQSSAISDALKLAQLNIEAANARLAQNNLPANQQAQFAQKDLELQEALRKLADLEKKLQDQEADRAAIMARASGADLSPDEIQTVDQLAGNDPSLNQMLSNCRRLSDRLRQLEADGYGDGHATVKATRQELADTEQRLKTYLADARANPPAKPSYQYVHVTIGKAGFISVDGGVGNWDTLREQLVKESESDRAKVVIVLAVETKDLPVGDFFLAQAMATEMVKELGLAYVSVAGVETYSGTAATRPAAVVYIGGHARRSGVYSIADTHMTISQLIIAAGGVEGGDDSHAWVTLIRRVDGAKKEALKDVLVFDIQSGTSDLYLQPDDTVEISTTEAPAATEPTGGVFFIGGHVSRPGVYSLVDRSRTLKQALDDAGGVASGAPPDPWLEVVRRVDGEKQVILWEHISDIQKGRAPDFKIQADDTVEIGTNAPPTERTKPTVKIQGNVGQPGEYSLQPNDSVGDLIRDARGVSDADANGVKVFLFRHQTELALPPINEILSLPHDEMLLEPDDMVVVTDPPRPPNDNAPAISGGLAPGPATAPSFNKSIRGLLFFVYGKFDLAQTGRPTDIDKSKIEELAIKSGGKIQNAIHADTDCLVIGIAPNLEPIAWEDRQDPIKLKVQHEAWSETIAYADVVNTANLLHIPVMNQDQFLALVK